MRLIVNDEGWYTARIGARRLCSRGRYRGWVTVCLAGDLGKPQSRNPSRGLCWKWTKHIGPKCHRNHNVGPKSRKELSHVMRGRFSSLVGVLRSRICPSHAMLVRTHCSPRVGPDHGGKLMRLCGMRLARHRNPGRRKPTD